MPPPPPPTGCFFVVGGIRFIILIIQVTGELELIMLSETIESDYMDNWNKWNSAILDYAQASSHPPAALQHALRDLPLNQCPSDDEFSVAHTHGESACMLNMYESHPYLCTHSPLH